MTVVIMVVMPGLLPVDLEVCVGLATAGTQQYDYETISTIGVITRMTQ